MSYLPQLSVLYTWENCISESGSPPWIPPAPQPITMYLSISPLCLRQCYPCGMLHFSHSGQQQALKLGTVGRPDLLSSVCCIPVPLFSFLPRIKKMYVRVSCAQYVTVYVCGQSLVAVLSAFSINLARVVSRLSFSCFMGRDKKTLAGPAAIFMPLLHPFINEGKDSFS